MEIVIIIWKRWYLRKWVSYLLVWYLDLERFIYLVAFYAEWREKLIFLSGKGFNKLLEKLFLFIFLLLSRVSFG